MNGHDNVGNLDFRWLWFMHLVGCVMNFTSVFKPDSAK